MKDLVSCFSEHAVRISDVACSGGSSSGSAGGAFAVVAESSGRAIQSTVSSIYRSCLSASHKDLLIHVTWSRSLDGPALSIAVHDTASRHHRSSSSGDPTATPRHLHKKKGSGTFTAGSCVVGIFWDYTAAKYGSGPEPVSGFYVAVVADAEFVLLLGDMSRDYVHRLHGGIPIAEFSMVSRRERFTGRGSCSTKVRFWETGAEHDITIGCEGEAWDAKQPELWVSVDDKRVVQLQRLRWNFRGNHTLFLEGGVPVDMMWDLHGWLFSGAGDTSASSCAVVTFQTRNTLEARLWLEEADDDDDEEGVPEHHHKFKVGGSGSGFCLLIQAFKSPAKIISTTTSHH